MEDMIIISVLFVIIGAAAWYIYRAKKSGKKCIGCPGGCACSNQEDGNAFCECCSLKQKK